MHCMYNLVFREILQAANKNNFEAQFIPNQIVLFLATVKKKIFGKNSICKMILDFVVIN